MPVQIALLRGVNLGATRKVSMSRLREVLATEGYRDVRTYIQSGNVLLASEAAPDAVGRDLERIVREAFALDVPVLVRTRDELAAAVSSNPFPDAANDGARYYAVFLDRDPDPARLSAIDPAAIEPDAFAVGDRVIYAWYRRGLHASRLASAIVEARLGATTTACNWNTVTKLLALATAMSADGQAAAAS